MYERPQYLTSRGLKRTHKNPTAEKSMLVPRTPSVPASATPLPSTKRLLTRHHRGEKVISPEAARLIAMVLKGMLHQRSG